LLHKTFAEPGEEEKDKGLKMNATPIKIQKYIDATNEVILEGRVTLSYARQDGWPFPTNLVDVDGLTAVVKNEHIVELLRDGVSIWRYSHEDNRATIKHKSEAIFNGGTSTGNNVLDAPTRQTGEGRPIDNMLLNPVASAPAPAVSHRERPVAQSNEGEGHLNALVGVGVFVAVMAVYVLAGKKATRSN
jgi:hypothetical protein